MDLGDAGPLCGVWPVRDEHYGGPRGCAAAGGAAEDGCWEGILRPRAGRRAFLTGAAASGSVLAVAAE